MTEHGKASANAIPEGPRFPGQPKTMRSMITGLDKAYQEKTVTLKGCDKTGYEMVKMPIDKIYSNLNLLPANALSARVGHASRQGSTAEWERLSHAYHGPGRQTRTRPIKLKDVFRADGQACPPRRVLVLACAGAGKTMAFTRKTTLDWSLGRIWTDKEIVLSFPLRTPEVHKAVRLQQLLEYYGEWSGAELDEMCVYMRDNMHRVCIILDGLDEIDLQTCSAFVMGIITGERMPGASVIITSRPSPEVLDLAGENPFDRRIEVTGFRKKDVGHYVSNVLKPADAAEVMRQVKASDYLTAFMRIPVNAVYICSLYRDGYNELPTTLPSIVSCMMLAAIKQQQGKLPGKAAKVPDTWEELSSEFLQPVLELGTFAFRMLAAKVVVFEQKHFLQCQLSEAAQSLGLLVSCEDVGRSRTPQWTLAHLTLQEALAARFVSSSLKTPTDVTWLAECLDPLAGHLSTFWKLLAAELSDECVAAQITAILTRQPRPAVTGVRAGSANSEAAMPTQSTTAATAAATKSATEAKPATDLTSITHLFKASRDDMLQLADKLSGFLTTSASERLASALLLDVVDGSGLLAVRAVMPQGSDLTGSSFLHHLLMLWVRRVPLASVHMLHRAIASFDQSTAEQCFPSCAIAPESPKPCADSEFQLANLRSEEGKHLLLLALQCYYEFKEARGQSPVIPSLQQALERYGIDFCGVRLMPSDCRAIAHALHQYHEVVTEVMISHCFVGDFGYQILVPGLAKCSKLARLDITDNNLTGLHCQNIANIIRQNHATLYRLFTLMYHFKSDDVALLHSNTHLCHKLRALEVGGSQCTDRAKDVATLSAVLSSCQLMTKVVLYDCAIGDSGLSQLQRHFVRLPLSVMQFQRVGVTAESSSVLCCILHEHHHRLTSLVLSRDALSDSFLFDAQATLAECSQLEDVILFDTQITDSSLPILAALLPHWPRLKRLGLSNNDFSKYDEAASSFVQALRSCPSPPKVYMPTKDLVNPALQALLASSPVEVVYYDMVSAFKLKADVAEAADKKDGDDEEESDE